MKYVELTCPSCSANLTVEQGRDILFCQNCGTKIAVTDAEIGDAKEQAKKEIKLAKIKARKELGLAYMDMQKKMMPIAVVSLVLSIPLIIALFYFLYKMYLLVM